MFKDYKKYLSTSLKVYLFVLLILFILKLVGLNYFSLDINNSTILKIDLFLSQYKLDYVYQILCLYFNFYLLNNIMLKESKFSLKSLISPTLIVVSAIVLKLTNLLQFYPIVNTSILFIYFLIKKVKIKRIAYVFIVNILCQAISLFVRNYNPQGYEIIANAIMNIDYYIMLLIWYTLEKQGGVGECQEVYLSSLKKTNLKKQLKALQKKLQQNLRKFKNKNFEEKLSIIFYVILSLIWNTLSLIIVLLVATLNHTFIECIFILTSFWLSKRAFGKPFHLKSMAQCFVISNLTYYGLNRITAPLGMSIAIPILLGVGLSYVTSKLVKKTYKPLYRGMPKELFEETILKVIDKNSNKYKICYDFYINKKSDLSLSFQYNYSIAGIRKIRIRLNDRIKKLE